ncbi:MAG: isochorismatase family protein [Candidatus Poribacteria bacterium]|nr:isochorismatase family protein [Candidatus Poribacteria bacterium]
MSMLDLRVRYFQDSTPADVPCREENFIRREITMPLPIEQNAFVLVDLWNVHFIESWIERAKDVTVNAVVPALNAAREAGLTIVHAPCPEVARQFSQLDRHTPPEPSPSPDWPPPEFRSRSGEYTVYRGPRSQPPGIGIHWDQLAQKLAMSPAIEVLDDDVVIATGEQLHDLLKGRGILHLIYVGFATNWCVLGRDYGIRAMARRGYNIILLRDATTGVEFPDTLDKLFITEVAIREVEQQYGFTASNEDFFAACRAASSNES